MFQSIFHIKKKSLPNLTIIEICWKRKVNVLLRISYLHYRGSEEECIPKPQTPHPQMRAYSERCNIPYIQIANQGPYAYAKNRIPNALFYNIRMQYNRVSSLTRRENVPDVQPNTRYLKQVDIQWERSSLRRYRQLLPIPLPYTHYPLLHYQQLSPTTKAALPRYPIHELIASLHPLRFLFRITAPHLFII